MLPKLQMISLPGTVETRPSWCSLMPPGRSTTTPSASTAAVATRPIIL
ncbi:Uncharacterised protein [Mycobacteroides abscessus subsp. abscessus]|nr:Uncharacterised protein [Mycobacteroides abscessus subsp. abscessus]